MRPRIMPVVVLALVAVALLGGVAYGEELATYTTPGECYTCHGVAGTGAVGKVDFEVAPVDYAKCKTCHSGYPGAGHYHFGYSIDYCANCHDDEAAFELALPAGATAVAGFRIPTVFGTYATATSLSASSADLHAVHLSEGWVESTFGAWGASCSRCHATAACTACHVDAVTHGDHAVSEYPAVGIRQATGATVSTTSSTCINSACHALSAAGIPAFTPSCTSCHVNAATVTHGVSHRAADGVEGGVACSACHSLELVAVHGGSDAAGAICVTCHPTPRKTFAAWDQTCATGGCHTAASTRPMHADITASHAVADSNLLCLDCHTGGELASIHVDAQDEVSGRTSCSVCHTGVVGQPATGDCTVCHFTFDDHYDEAAHSSTTASCSGEGCHAVTSGLMTVHEERNAAFGCFGCHNSIRTAVQDAIAAGDTTCGACHGTISTLGGHRDAHAAVPPLASASGVPSYSYYAGSTGTAPTRDCVGCHTSNLVDEHMGLYYGGWVVAARLDNMGAPFTCGTCHDQEQGSDVQNAIGAGLSACESCHPVHGPINALHTSAFVDSPEAPCADCHSANLAEEHNGQYTSSAGLTGCDVCHDLYEGLTSGAVTGTDTMAAIDTANDTRCSACHTAYHTDSAAHEASGAESLACGSCHAKGQTVIDVAASALHPTCATCHKSTRLGEISGHTAECGSCHATEGTDYHSAMTAGHTYTAMDESCASCHANTLPEVHTEFLSRYPAYDSTCDLCHKNADPSRIDWATASADCSSCHEIHGDIAVVHTATSSQACVDCHESADVRTLHAATPDASCDVCHNAPAGRIDWATATVECTSCHGMLAPVDPKHYPAQAHSATTETGCTLCHSVDMKTEHFKSTVAVSCVACHELRVDTFTAPWDKTCTACHPTKHANQAIAHKSTNTACTGTGCHVVTDVSVLHGTNCAACHAVGVTASTNCTLCHSGSNPHHVTITLMATTDSGWKTMCGSCHGRTHSMSGCSRCHSVSKLHSESRHVDRNSQCAGCHKIAAADASDDCLRCHTSLSSGSGGGSWGGGSWGGGSWGGGSWGGGSWGGR